jgi:hypothetical protein
MTDRTRHLTAPALLVAAATLALALLLLLGGPSAARAGGFSVTTLDPLPDAPRAGATLAVGYTVRAHGVTPTPAEDTGIAVVTPGGREVFPGRQEGPVGHYVARVELPGAGIWRWELDWGGYPAQDLGTLTVLPAGPASAGAPVAEAGDTGGPGPLAWVLLGLTGAAGALLAARLVALRRAPAAG